jgi:hypothetical protein
MTFLTAGIVTSVGIHVFFFFFSQLCYLSYLP